MGSNTLNSTAGGAITTTLVNQFFTALGGDLVPRLVSGSSAAPSDNTAKLGLPAYRWAEIHAEQLYVAGALFDPASVGVDSNWAIVSGATRSGSGMPDFLRASGSGASATILATTTNLAITAAGTSVTITSDISVSSLTTAPGSNNTCAVDDAALTDQEASKYTGEADNNPITVDAMGSEISDRVGEYVCLKTPDGEYMLAYVESTTELSRCYRGFFFDSSGSPVERGTIADNDTLTLMSLGWVFIDNDGSTVDVTYTTPIWAHDEPGSPATDDYWWDAGERQWKRYDGADWQDVDRVPVGLLVIDGINCVASRSFDFTASYNPLNEILCKRFSDTVVHSIEGRSSVSVYGISQEFFGGPIIWDTAADFESGVTEASGTTYYLYITESGDTIISDQKYYNRLHDLRGLYHPYHSWRCVGIVQNDGSSNFDTVSNPEQIGIDVQEFSASGTWYKPPRGTTALVRMWGAGGGGSAHAGGGGGGGGAFVEIWISLDSLGASETVTIGAGGAVNTAGGNTTFGSHATAYGGGGCGNGPSYGGGGGGGQTSAGGTSSSAAGGAGGTPGHGEGGASGNPGLDNPAGGGGGAGGTNVDVDAGSSFWGGGGGAGGNNQATSKAGSSIYGGGGGACNNASNPGISLYGGNGGANGVAGSSPGGGGGRNAAGGDGKCVVYVF